MNVSPEVPWFPTLTLAERAALLDPTVDVPTAPTASDLEQRWRRLPPFVEARIFDQRLASEALDSTTLRAAIELQPQDTPSDSAPPWVNRLEAALTGREGTPEADTAPADATDIPLYELDRAIESTRFLRLVEPLVRNAFVRLRQRLTADLVASPLAHFDPEETAKLLVASLPGRLAMLIRRALILELNIARLEESLEGDTPEARFDDFIERLGNTDEQRRIFAEYPVMTRQVLLRIEQWLETSREVILHLRDDWHQLEALWAPADGSGLGRLTQAQASLGDSHRGGRSVVRVAFDSGVELIYKPRSMASEVLFNELLSWLNDAGFEPRFRTLQVLDRSDHGWVERVQKFPCKTAEEIDRFYQRQGALVTLLYVLNASDIHYENILASGEHPVLVDLETLFLPRITDRPSGSELTFLEAMKRSVLAPGILPHRGRASHGEGVTDLSGMTDGEGQKTAVPMLQAVDLATDRMRFEHVYRDIPGADNMPRLADHRVVASDYSDAICAGFERAYRLLMRHRTTLLSDSGPIAAFAGCEMRLVFRPTRVYAALLFESFHPDVLRDALEREMLLDSLWHAVDEGPFMVRLLQAEKHDLLNVDVPIFNTRVDSTTLFDSQGGPIDGVIADSGLTVVRQIVAALGERDLERQLWLVRASLATLDLATTRNFERSPMVLHRDPQPAAENHLLTAADEVARALRHLAYTDSERAGWYTFEYLEHPHWTLQYAGPTLYDGLSGIALFLAHHGAVRNDTASTHFASRAIRQVLETVHRAPETLESVGAFAGRGSILYALLHLADLWDDPLLVDAAESMVPGLLPLIERDEMHDIVGGNAGCLITLLELHSKRPSSATLAAAQACGERLLAAAQPQAKGVAWPLAAAGSQPLVGFSHGTAGVAWALLRLHAITGDRRTKATALEALAYENSLFDPLQGNWPDLREGERPGDDPDHDGHHFLNAWCHGAPGILLARLLSLPHLDTPGVRREIEAALHTTVEHGFDAGHCLCHGALGNLDILMIAGEALERPELGEQARRLATSVLDDQATSGWRYGTLGRLTPPGLLVGLAGFGYQLLRVAQPNRVPSVLALAPPRGKR